MSITEQLLTWWVVEWHPEGAVTFEPLREMVRRNHEAAVSQVQTERRIVVGLMPTMDAAEEAVRRLKREIGEKRKACFEGAGNNGQNGEREPSPRPSPAGGREREK